MARIHVHTVSCNERELMPFFMSHYRVFVRAERIVVHYDDSTTDGSDELARGLGAETVHHARQAGADGSVPLDDKYLRDLRNTSWHSSRGSADWIIIVDVDELVMHPNIHALLDAAPANVSVLQPEGWELVGEFPPAGKQLWESVRTGVRNEYSNKPCVFRPEVEIGLSIGSHDARPTKSGEPVEIHSAPQLKLLHCVFLGGDYLLRKQAMKRDRPMTDLNRQFNWGGHWRREDEQVLRDWEEAKKRAVPIPDLPAITN